MATYIPGMTDYIAQYQPFQPDFNFLSNVLQTKQNKFDLNTKKVNRYYGSLLNAAMTREDNIERREEFFKAVDNDIKKLSGLDLSLQQNVQYAESLFDPLVNDKYIQHDMIWTKHYNNEMQKAESYKNCINPKDCGGEYWDGGVQYMQLQREKFKNAGADESFSIGTAKFTPKQNVPKMAFDYLKDNDLKVEFEENINGWVVKTVNGQKTVGNFNALLKSIYGNDEKVKEYYNVNAALHRESFVRGKEQEGIDRVQATMMWNNNVSKQGLKENSKEKEIVEKEISNAKGQLEEAKAIGADKNIFEQILHKVEALTQLKKEKDNVQGAIDNNTLNRDNIQRLEFNSDYIYSQALMNNELNQAANNYAMLTAERTQKVDPYKLEDVRFKKQVLLEGIRFDNQKELREYDRETKIALARIKDGGRAISQMEDAAFKLRTGDLSGLEFEEINVPDAATPKITDVYERNKKYFDNTQNERISIERSLISSSNGKYNNVDDIINEYKSIVNNPDDITNESEIIPNTEWLLENGGQINYLITLKDAENELAKNFRKYSEDATLIMLDKYKKEAEEETGDDKAEALIKKTFIDIIRSSKNGLYLNEDEKKTFIDEMVDTYGGYLDSDTEDQVEEINEILEEINEEYIDAFNENGGSLWSSVVSDIYGTTANAEAARNGLRFDFNYNVTPENKLFVLSSWKDYNKNINENYIFKGNVTSIEEDAITDEKAKGVAELIMREIGNSKNKEPLGNVSLQAIGGGNGDYYKMILNPSNDIINEYNKGRKKEQKIGVDDYSEISVFIKSEDAESYFMNNAKTSIYDYLVNTNEGLSINVPYGGKANVKKIDKGTYKANMTVLMFNGDSGKFEETTKEKSISHDGDIAYNTISRVLSEQAIKNRIALVNYNKSRQ